MNKEKFDRTLPLLNKIGLLFNKLDLSKILIISVQHLYSTTYAMFKILFKNGLKPHNLFILGKCYSTDPEVFSKLQKDGVNVSPYSLSYNSHNDYDLEFKMFINNYLENIKNKINFSEFEKVIILDDGGHLIESFFNKFPYEYSNVIGIEQTSAGYNILKKHIILFPIINLARSAVKLKYETPIIINLVQKKLLEKISSFSDIKNILIVGNGVLGQHVCQVLKKYNLNILTFDLISNKSDFSIEALSKTLNKFDLIIGCTGTTSLKSEYFENLKSSTILASISSSDREFEAHLLRKKTNMTNDCHKDIKINNVTLLNNGFPINFDADYDIIDTDDFQLTRSLLLASIYQALIQKITTKRFVKLNSNVQKMLLKELLRIKDFSDKKR